MLQALDLTLWDHFFLQWNSDCQQPRTSCIHSAFFSFISKKPPFIFVRFKRRHAQLHMHWKKVMVKRLKELWKTVPAEVNMPTVHAKSQEHWRENSHFSFARNKFLPISRLRGPSMDYQDCWAPWTDFCSIPHFLAIMVFFDSFLRICCRKTDTEGRAAIVEIQIYSDLDTVTN